MSPCPSHEHAPIGARPRTPTRGTPGLFAVLLAGACRTPSVRRQLSRNVRDDGSSSSPARAGLRLHGLGLRGLANLSGALEGTS